jgi:hypothetical protein|tara:strand:+ start:2161 stop:2463 length:303 start_codon:yes stop_codon:yes gene_type:complete
MIDYEGKQLEDLSMEETIEFEKQMLKRVLAASKAGMSEGLIDQINLFIALIRDHKTQISQTAIYKLQNKDEDGSVLDIGEIDIPPPDQSIEQILDFYKKM